MEKITLKARQVWESAGRVLYHLENLKVFRGGLFFVLLMMMTLSIYLLNLYTPLILDDYDFMFSWATGERVSGFVDVIRSQLVHYQIWGGRLLHVFTQSFLYLGKAVFNVANTAVFMLLLLEIYAIARPAHRPFCWTILLLSYLALMTMLPFFGTVFLWLTGSCLYLFGTALALLPLLIVRSVREGGFFARGWIGAAMCLPVGILAGWTNENTACGMLALMALIFVSNYLRNKKACPTLALLLVGQCIGAMLLLLAPGNAVRASVYTYDSIIIELIRRFVSVTAYGMSYLGILLALVILFCAGMGSNARRTEVFELVFASLMSVYAMVGSPELSDRTYTGPFVLMLTALLMLIADGENHVRKLDAAKIAVLPLVLVFAAYTGYHAVKDVRGFADEWNSQIETIELACQAGEKQVMIEPVRSVSRFTMDIIVQPQAQQWPNSTITKYYGIDIVGP